MFENIKSLWKQASHVHAYTKSIALDAREIKKTVGIMADIIESRLDHVPYGDVLHAAIGEDHVHAAHIVAKDQLNKELHRRGLPFGTIYEGRLQGIFGRVKNHVDSWAGNAGRAQDVPFILGEINNDPAQNAFKIVAGPTFPEAPLSHIALYDTLNKLKTPFAFGDAHFKDIYEDVPHLDQRDPQTRYAIFDAQERLYGAAGGNLGNIPVNEHLGMLARNLHLRDACEALHAKHKDLRVILLDVGASHVAGGMKSAYETGLAHLFAERLQHFAGFKLPVTDENAEYKKMANAAYVMHTPLTSPSVFLLNAKKTIASEENLNMLSAEAKYLSALASHFGEEIDEDVFFDSYFATATRINAHIENDIIMRTPRASATRDIPEPHFTNAPS